jgi:hypothetical protein
VDLEKIFGMVDPKFSSITSKVIDACNAGISTTVAHLILSLEIYAEVMAVRKLPSQMLYPHFAAKSPFLVDRFQDWVVRIARLLGCP